MIETVLWPTGAALSSPFTRLSIGKLLQALDRVLSNSTDAAAPLDQVPATSSSRLKGGPRSRDIMLEAEHAKRTLRVDRTEGEKEFAQLLEQYPQDGMVYLLGAKRGWKLVTYVVPTQTCCAPRSYCMAKTLNS
jgi:hypothetical protein